MWLINEITVSFPIQLSNNEDFVTVTKDILPAKRIRDKEKGARERGGEREKQKETE